MSEGAQEGFRRKRPDLLHTGWRTVYNSILVTNNSTEMGIKVIPHPPYNLDLVIQCNG